MRKGLFLVIDGNDGSGKATQARLLADRLEKEGIASEKIDFPQYENNFFGKLLGECLAGQHGDFVQLSPRIASTLYALDRLETTPRIREWLSQGKVVIADRFSSSNQIHQGGKIEDDGLRAEFLGWLDRMEHEVLDIPRPDAVIYLQVPVEISLALLAKKRDTKNSALGAEAQDMVEKDRQYLERSVISAGRLAAVHPGWHRIDCIEDNAMRSPEAIHEEVFRILQKLV